MPTKLVERKNEFAVVNLTAKKHVICARRIGSKERLSPIAECASEEIAMRIVDGLHLRQKDEIKINTAAETQINSLKSDLASERAKAVGAQTEAGRLRDEVRSLGRKIDEVTGQRNRLQLQLEQAKQENEALQAKVAAARAGETV